MEHIFATFDLKSFGNQYSFPKLSTVNEGAGGGDDDPTFIKLGIGLSLLGTGFCVKCFMWIIVVNFHGTSV